MSVNEKIQRLKELASFTDFFTESVINFNKTNTDYRVSFTDPIPVETEWLSSYDGQSFLSCSRITIFLIVLLSKYLQQEYLLTITILLLTLILLINITLS
jgi:hypothetical protein